MSLRYKLNRAQALITELSPAEHDELKRICEAVQRSQAALLQNAGAAMQQCIHNCEGLCCRNAQVDDIIGLWDLVFILTLKPALAETMAQRVAEEKPFYSADCLFLKSRIGPCIFAADIRPEVCVTTFCSGDAGIQKEIRAVKRQFFRLPWFFFKRKLRVIWTALQRVLKTGPFPMRHR